MKSRHELREAVFKILFQVENTELDFIELLDLEQEEISTSIYVNKTLTEILEKKEYIYYSLENFACQNAEVLLFCFQNF